MGSIEHFEHTADVGFRVRGDDLDDLFRTSAQAMFDYIVTNREDVRTEAEESLVLQADAADSLLAAWLNELIFRCETQHRLYARFDVHVADDGLSLHATIFGEPIDRDRHVLDHEVKAVTRHALSLQREAGGWLAELVLDI